MRDPHPLGDPRRDPDRPIGTGRDDPVDRARAREPVDALLVLGGEDRPLVGERETRGKRVAVDCDDLELAAPARRLEEAELRRPRAEHEEATRGRPHSAVTETGASARTPRHQDSFSRYQATVRSSPSAKQSRSASP